MVQPLSRKNTKIFVMKIPSLFISFKTSVSIFLQLTHFSSYYDFFYFI